MKTDGGQIRFSRPGWAPAAPDGVDEHYLDGHRVALLHGSPPGADVYRTGQNSWSPAGWQPLTASPLRIANPVRRNTADDTVWDDPVRHHSSWVVAISEGGRAMLLGALEGDTPRTHADVDVMAGWTETGAPGLWVMLEGPELAVFDRYRDLLGARYGVRDEDPGTVWSSWYSFYEGISRDIFDEVMPQLPGLGFNTFQVDDGWQRIVGDWVPNAKFPTGMADLAEASADLGMRPGLWLAPFIVLPGSEAFLRHKQMLLRGADGEPVVAGSNWGSSYFAYDFTRSDAQDMLAGLMRTAVDWGYTYLKLDFLQAGAVAGVRSKDMDREAAYRQAIQVMRDAAGEGTYLLGSGALVMPSLGILDAVRTGPDVAPMWTNYATDDPSDALAFNALRNGVERLWLRHLIGIDPDVVFFRRRRNLLSDEQIGWLHDVATLSGFRAVSDPPSWLTDEEKDQLRAYLAARPDTSRQSRYGFTVGGRDVDFSDAISGGQSLYAL